MFLNFLVLVYVCVCVSTNKTVGACDFKASLERWYLSNCLKEVKVWAIQIAAGQGALAGETYEAPVGSLLYGFQEHHEGRKLVRN